MKCTWAKPRAGTHRPFARFADGGMDGAMDADGRVMGSYCHGLFAATPLRAALLARLGVASQGIMPPRSMMRWMRLRAGWRSISTLTA
jgi:cobyric acid synthase